MLQTLRFPSRQRPSHILFLLTRASRALKRVMRTLADKTTVLRRSYRMLLGFRLCITLGRLLRPFFELLRLTSFDPGLHRLSVSACMK